MRSGRLPKRSNRFAAKTETFMFGGAANCKVVVELYAGNVTRDHNHALYSVTKPILATLIGVS